MVYGPAGDVRKDEFRAELARSAPLPFETSLLNDNFNLIYEARDKNNLNLKRKIMGRFKAAIDNTSLK